MLARSSTQGFHFPEEVFGQDILSVKGACESRVKSAFGLSVIFHLAFGLIVGLWLCPWFERITPDRHGTVDIDYLVVGEKSSGGTKAVEPVRPAPRKQTPAKTVSAPPTSTGVAVAVAPPVAAPAVSLAPSANGSVTIDGDGSPRVLSIAEYLKWV